MDRIGCQQEPKTVFSCDDELLCGHSQHMADGRVYFLMFIVYIDGEEECKVDIWEAKLVLAFDPDDEVVTSAVVPDKGEFISHNKML